MPVVFTFQIGTLNRSGPAKVGDVLIRYKITVWFLASYVEGASGI